MPVDQGGLRYNIEVTDQFSTSTQKFREEMQGARDSLDGFRDDITKFNNASRDGKKGLESLAKGQKEVNTALSALTSKVKSYKTAVRGAATSEKALVREQKKSLQQSKGFSKARQRQVNALKAQAKVAGRLATATKGLARASGQALKNTKGQRDATRKVVAASKLARKTFIAEAEAIRKLARQRRADARAAQQQARAISRVRTGLVNNQVRRAQGPRSQVVSNATNARLRKARAGFLGVANSSRKARRETSGFARVFTRLISAFVFFAAARGVVNGFKAMISSAISFNSVIEQSVLGISSLIVAVGEVRDTTGAATTSAQQLALAQVEARRQVALLRREGLRTAATFAQLTQTFQTAVAPGLQAGLNLDEIRDLTVRISQAASAIGLPQEQLAEEVRSLLGGTITPRQTRIATALGITNEDIARFKELGTLSDELQTRFEAFAVAGEEALDTFQARLTNTVDALQQLASEAGLGFFESIKGILGDIQSSIVRITDAGVLINPKAVSIARAFFNGLKAAVDEARKLGRDLSFDDFAGVAKAAGATLAGAARIVGAIIRGFVKGLDAVTRIFQEVQSRIQQTSSNFDDILSVENLLLAVETITEFSVVFGSILIAAKALSIAFGSLGIIIKGISLVVSSVGLVMKGIAITAGLLTTSFFTVTAPILLAAALLIGVATLMKQWLDDVAGVELRFSTIVKIIKVTLIGAFKLFGATAKLILNGVILFFETGFRLMIIGIIALIQQITKLATKIIGFFNESATKGLKEFDKTADKVGKRQSAALKKRINEQSKLVIASKNALKETFSDVSDEVGDGILDAIRDNKNATGFKDTLLEGISGLKGGLSGILDDLGLGPALGGLIGEEATDEAKKLSDVFKEIPPAISKANAGLKTFSSDLAKLREDTLKTKEELEAGLNAIGTSGIGANQQKTLLEGQRRIQQETLKIDQEIQGSRARQTSLSAQLLNNQERVNKLTKSEQKAIMEGVVLGREAAAARRQIAIEETRAGAAKLSIQKAGKKFDSEAALQQTELLYLALERKSLLEKELETINKKADALQDGREPESKKQINQLVAQQISLAGQLKLVGEDIAAQLKARGQVEREINEAIKNRILLSSRQETARLGQLIAERRVELDIAKQLFSVRGSLNELEIRAAEERSDVADQRLRVSQLRQEQEANLNLLNINIENAKTDEIRNALIEQRTALLKENAVAMELESEILRQQQAEAQAVNDIAEAPVKFGFLAAIVDFSKDSLDTFKTTLRVMTELLEGVASIWNDSIAAALDPSKGPVDILGKFQDLLNKIVQTIIDAFLRAQVFKLLTSVFGFSSGDLTTLGLGRAEGGNIPKGDRRAMPSPAHAFARGYVDGGHIERSIARPRGVDPRDTEPIWAQPGEFMQPVKRVQQYGSDLMEMIRRGIADPGALRAAAGLGPRRMRSMKVPTGTSLAEGGSVARSALSSASGGRRPKIVNLVSPELIQNEILSDDGQDTILNIIRTNQEEL